MEDYLAWCILNPGILLRQNTSSGYARLDVTLLYTLHSVLRTMRARMVAQVITTVLTSQDV